MIEYKDFASAVKAAGLEPVICYGGYWEIRGGTNHPPVCCRPVFWGPDEPAGLCFYLKSDSDGTSRHGAIADAIALAGAPAAPEETTDLADAEVALADAVEAVKLLKPWAQTARNNITRINSESLPEYSEVRKRADDVLKRAAERKS